MGEMKFFKTCQVVSMLVWKWLRNTDAFARSLAFWKKGGAEVFFNSEALVICADENPSVDYFIKPYLATKGISAQLVSVDGRCFARINWRGVRIAIVVRYLPENWVRPLREFQQAGGHIIYFMDDDLMDVRALVNLPTVYAKKVRRLATDQLHVIDSLSHEYWVTSRFLAEKYSRWSPKILTPLVNEALLESKPSISVFYHGSASHQTELKWLVSVMDVVQERTATTHFEVFGDLKINRLYRHLPRVAILHPMRWPNYLAYTSSVRRDIGLAPLMPDPFNSARAPTKFFDFVRMGAVGIYSDVPPYSDFIRAGVDGILLPNDPSAWIDAIIELATDEKRRATMTAAAQARALSVMGGSGVGV